MTLTVISTAVALAGASGPVAAQTALATAERVAVTRADLQAYDSQDATTQRALHSDLATGPRCPD